MEERLLFVAQPRNFGAWDDSMQLYDKLRPLLEEYFRISDEWQDYETWQAPQNPSWNFRQRELKARRIKLQTEIQHLTRMDRRLVN